MFDMRLHLPFMDTSVAERDNGSVQRDLFLKKYRRRPETVNLRAPETTKQTTNLVAK